MASDAVKVYEMLWRNKWLTADAKTIDDMILSLEGAANHLKEMREAGISLEEGGTADDYARRVTIDPRVAEKFDLQEMEWE